MRIASNCGWCRLCAIFSGRTCTIQNRTMSDDRDDEEHEEREERRQLVFEPRATAATHVPPTGRPATTRLPGDRRCAPTSSEGRVAQDLESGDWTSFGPPVTFDLARRVPGRYVTRIARSHARATTCGWQSLTAATSRALISGGTGPLRYSGGHGRRGHATSTAFVGRDRPDLKFCTFTASQAPDAPLRSLEREVLGHRRRRPAIPSGGRGPIDT